MSAQAQRVKTTQALAGLPPEYPVSPLLQIRQEIRARGSKLVVLDDDPTGTQTVHDIPVLTEWSVETLANELASDVAGLYILTNSRSLPLPQAQSLNVLIGRNLLAASQQAGRAITVVSRSDSTLRGHFPGEVQALADALGQAFDGWLIIPYFLEGGRYTIGNVHYVAEGDMLVPAGETEFARDHSFGYHASDLREWVAEKTGGRIPADAVAFISIEDIRMGGPDRVAGLLGELENGRVCVVNAATIRDLEVFVAGLFKAEARGKRFLYRTAASFVQVRLGQTLRPLLTSSDLALDTDGAALVVVGSYVPKTTGQVEALLAQPGIAGVEVDTHALLEPNRAPAEIARVAAEADHNLREGRDTVVYTGRRLITGADASATLSIGAQVSAALVDIVRAIQTRPRYLVAKGGITSSDVATRGLDVKRALVLGQILPGVPVWQLGLESRHPGLAYIVFPGNVGGPEALAEIVTRLRYDNP